MISVRSREVCGVQDGRVTRFRTLTMYADRAARGGVREQGDGAAEARAIGGRDGIEDEVEAVRSLSALQVAEPQLETALFSGCLTKIGVDEWM